ncbi:MAG: hypothetical protein L0027_16405, partial [Candidatus Rokubacteria bacterium]|nr:hypothetical protein [Candidatus Rokubacteria bacterium]
MPTHSKHRPCPFPPAGAPEDARWADHAAADLAQQTPTAAPFPQAGQIVKDDAYRREEARLTALLADDEIGESGARFVSDML